MRLATSGVFGSSTPFRKSFIYFFFILLLGFHIYETTGLSLKFVLVGGNLIELIGLCQLTENLIQIEKLIVKTPFISVLLDKELISLLNY
jgi:hypothetical protein